MFLKLSEQERVFVDVLSFLRRDYMAIIGSILVAIRKYVCHLVSEMCTTSSAQFRYIVARWHNITVSKPTTPLKFKRSLHKSGVVHCQNIPVPVSMIGVFQAK
jgi:hypothetical protein